MATVTSGYTCDNCGCFWDSQYEASDCCPTDIWDAYQCDECQEIHDDFTSAEFCCPDEDDEENDCAA